MLPIGWFIKNKHIAVTFITRNFIKCLMFFITPLMASLIAHIKYLQASAATGFVVWLDL